MKSTPTKGNSPNLSGVCFFFWVRVRSLIRILDLIGIFVEMLNATKYAADVQPVGSFNSIASMEEVTHFRNHQVIQFCENDTDHGIAQLLSDVLLKIVPYVQNDQEDFLHWLMLAIKCHQHRNKRVTLTRAFFSLIQRPNEKQRQIIMDECVILAEKVGEFRTETELLPQCWELIDDIYEESRLLVAESCVQLAEFVRPEIRAPLILSIFQKLIEDSAVVVRDAAAHKLALLLPLFPNTDNYFEVEEMMFRLVCDPSGMVVETAIKVLVPALLKWEKNLDHLIRALFSHMCLPLLGVRNSNINYRLPTEGERQKVDMLLHLLLKLLPFVHRTCIQTCPYPYLLDPPMTSIPMPVLQKYAEGYVPWPAFDVLHELCFPRLVDLVYDFPEKGDKLRDHISRFLMAVAKLYGDHYVTHIMLPLFLVAVGDDADFTCFPTTALSKVEAQRPQEILRKKIASECILPILLVGVLGSLRDGGALTNYVRNLLIKHAELGSRSVISSDVDVYDCVCFLCMFEEHRYKVSRIISEMVRSTNTDHKIEAAKLIKAIVPNLDAQVALSNFLYALETLASDSYTYVKFATIDAFGTAAQNFKSDEIIDMIRVHMDAYLELDRSHVIVIAVIRALIEAIPHTTDSLRDYLLSKLYRLSAFSIYPWDDIVQRREKINIFCEAIRALYATDLSVASVRGLLLPTIQNLLKDEKALDPSHMDALNIIVQKEKYSRIFYTLSMVISVMLSLMARLLAYICRKRRQPQPKLKLETSRSNNRSASITLQQRSITFNK